MILGGVGIRDEDERQGKMRKLREARRAAPRDRKIRRAVGLFHSMMKRQHRRSDADLRVALAHELFVLLPGEMDDLQWLRGERGKRVDQRLVDPVRALAAAHDEER